MAGRIPLNYFRRQAFNLTPTPTVLYTAPFDRAAIILACYATNVTSDDVTVSLSLSGIGAQFVPIQPQVYYAKNILVSGNDTTSLAPQKLVLGQYDAIIGSCSESNKIVLNVSLLETLNQV